MKLKSLNELTEVAEVYPKVSRRKKMTKRQRLERWAEVLEQHQGGSLRSLMRTEYAPEAERAWMRTDNSPLTVAFEDPMLRADGLRSDKLGEAMRFFGLSDWEVHSIVCYCHYGHTMSAKEVAGRVRIAAARAEEHKWPSLETVFTVGSVAAAILFTVSVL
jgi:hypothetical protein